MAQGPAGQFRYVDLSNERGVRFGGQCPICAARYATPLQPQPPGTPPSEVEAARREVFDLFITAWHELEVDCRGCRRPACPLCWDEEQGLCAECVAQRGLTRTPFRGVATSGPLADGRLQVVETGRYSDVARPAWLGNLIAKHTGRPQTTGDLGAGPDARGAGGPAQPWMQGPSTNGENARKAYPDAPFVPNDGNMVAAAQTLHVPAPNRGAQDISVMPTESLRPQRGPSTAEVHIPNPEGVATSTMVECPRCGTQNYDFVTRCTVCQLQLIQICPLCEKLNPGQATRCEHCGSPLSRPRGWSGVVGQRLPATALQPEERLWDDMPAPSVPDPVASYGGYGPNGGYGQTADAHGGHGQAPVSTDSAWSAAGYEPPVLAPAPAKRRRTTAPVRLPTLPPEPTMPTTALPDQLAGMPDAYVERPPGPLASAFAVAERALTMTLLVAIVAIIIGTVAAELSPSANAALRGLFHIDVRQTLDQFARQVQLIFQRSHG